MKNDPIISDYVANLPHIRRALAAQRRKSEVPALISAACPEFAVRIVEQLEREVDAMRMSRDHARQNAIRLESEKAALRQASTITLPLADVVALVRLAQEQTRYIEETDSSVTGSIYGIEYSDKTIARVAVRLPQS